MLLCSQCITYRHIIKENLIRIFAKIHKTLSYDRKTNKSVCPFENLQIKIKLPQLGKVKQTIISVSKTNKHLSIIYLMIISGFTNFLLSNIPIIVKSEIKASTLTLILPTCMALYKSEAISLALSHLKSFCATCQPSMVLKNLVLQCHLVPRASL